MLPAMSLTPTGPTVHRPALPLGVRAPAPLSARALPLQGRRSAAYVPQAAAGGGSTGSGGGKVTGGGGGGGGSGSGGRPNDQPNEGDGQGKKKGGMFQGWADRVAYDPEFPIKVLMEQIIGVGACVIGDMSARPNWGLNELDFIFSTLVVGSIMNFSIMYLLAPTAGTAAAGAASMGLVEKLLSDVILKSWGAPGGNMFEPGAYSVGKRLLNFGYKGVVFACIGFCAGVFGTAMSNGLLTLRKRMDPSFELQNEPPNIIYNACTWGIHMGLSSNLRYQTLGGLDQVLVKAMPIGAFRVYQAVIRAANNIVGGISFVTLARLTGVQKAAEPAPAAAAAASSSGGSGSSSKKDSKKSA